MKFAFIYNFKKSNWKSCEVISSNLLKTYARFLKKNQVKNFCLGEQSKDFHNLALVSELVSFSPTHIVIVDHKPHPIKLFKFLKEKYSATPQEKKPEIIIHVFGDFTLYGASWCDSGVYLKHFKVKFICASDRQADLIAKFLNNPKFVYKCPFPVDEKHFYFQEKIRNNLRKKLGLNDGQIMYLYTGRMSLQKKVIELTFDFAQFLKMTKTDAYLYLAGDYDDLGNPFIGAHTKHGEFCQRHILLLDSIPEQIRSRIIYVGNLNSEDLLKYYNAADYYISMSAHNDEDYGMSPAEAICTGLPAILTNWAGYASFFLDDKNATRLVPVEFSATTGVGYNSKSLMKEFFYSVSKSNFNRKKRVEYSKLNAKNFSITGNVSTVEKIVNAQAELFTGFSNLLERFAGAYEKERPPFAIYKYEIVYTDLYKEAYASYLQKDFQ